jgi:4a-hydroxytetrahydrobiopterin dehydratase
MRAKTAKLTASEIESSLAQLPGWTLAAGKLHREFKFADFGKAFEFMATAAPLIEKMDHHPEWCNVYNRVVVDLTTHDVEGISQKDVDLAKLLDSAASKFK